MLGDLSEIGAGKRNQISLVLLKEREIYTWLVVESFQPGSCGQLYDILESLPAFRKQHDLVEFIVFVFQIREPF